jgi:RHS repeat-associated protein
MKTLAAALAGLILAAGASQAQDVVEYYHLDAIGNVRAVSNQANVVIERHDYLPFGEECTTGPCATNPGAGAGQPRKFTGKERDQETGLDYFGARYYGARIARFTTVDPIYTWRDNLLDPQRWNRYAYSLNNPLRYVDPDGRQVAPGQIYVSGQGWTNRSTLDPANVATPEMAMQFAGVTVGIGLFSAAVPVLSGVAVEAQIGIGVAGTKAGQMIAGSYGQVARSELEMAAKAGGPTVSAVTRLTSAPEAGRALSVAAGEGAEAVANAARSGGTLYRGEIPQALISTMERVGLVRTSTTMMEGGARATEYRFTPAASEFVTRFFSEASK